MKKISKIISVLFIVFLVSCTGEDGEDGNANVITSEWIPTEFSTTPTSFTFFSVEDVNINEENAANAAIVAHGMTSAGEIVTIPFARGSRFYFFSLAPSTNEILFRGETINGGPQAIFNDLTDVRYTIIPSN